MPRILDSLRQSELICEIIVWNNNPETVFKAPDDIVVINTSRDLGLNTRFAAALLAKQDAILFIDDDIVLSPEKIRRLYFHWKESPDVCHAAFGRRCSSGPYNKIDAWGEVDVVLTKAVIVNRSVCLRAAMNISLLTDLPGRPDGNGEDILLSYTAIATSGKLNKAHNLMIVQEPQDPKIAISKREPTHVEHRTKVLERCRSLLLDQSLRAMVQNDEFFSESTISPAETPVNPDVAL
jgi:glycosyltransferase involved in cell wall biosynthesis